MNAEECPVCTAPLSNGRFWLTVCPSCKFDLEDPRTALPTCTAPVVQSEQK